MCLFYYSAPVNCLRGGIGMAIIVGPPVRPSHVCSVAFNLHIMGLHGSDLICSTISCPLMSRADSVPLLNISLNWHQTWQVHLCRNSIGLIYLRSCSAKLSSFPGLWSVEEFPCRWTFGHVPLHYRRSMTLWFSEPFPRICKQTVDNIVVKLSRLTSYGTLHALLLFGRTVLNPYHNHPDSGLTHWGRDEIDAISQTTFSNVFSWMNMNEFRLGFHWSLFLSSN